MNCKNCGTEIDQNQKFCQNCGNKVESEVVNSNEISNQNPINTSAPKSGDGLKTASLVLGIISLVLCMFNLLTLPLAIIGLVLGIVSKVKNKKTPAGLVLNIVAIVLCILIFLAGMLLMKFFEEYGRELYEYSGRYEQSTKYPSYYGNDKDDKYSVGYKTVGDSKVGYMKVPSTFVKFYDASGVDAIQYSTLDKSWIVTMKNLKDGVSKSSYADILYEKLESEDVKSLTKTLRFVGESKTLAYKLNCYYEDEGIYLSIWIFEDSDGSPYFISIEGPTKNSEYFDLIDTFTFEK